MEFSRHIDRQLADRGTVAAVAPPEPTNGKFAITGKVTPFRPANLKPQPEWITKLDKPTRAAIEALIAAQGHCSAEAVQNQIAEAIKTVRFPSVREWAQDAVERGMAGEKLSAGDWRAIADYLNSRINGESSGKDTVTG